MTDRDLELELGELRSAAFDMVLASRNFGLQRPPVADRIKQFMAAHAAIADRVAILADKVSAA